MTFQSDASLQGRTFEAVVINNLTLAGWRIARHPWREPTTLVEIDVVAEDPDGRIWWIECKGSWLSTSGRNGTTRTDTAKKLVGNAALLSTVTGRPPYMLVTSDMPAPGTPARRWIDTALERGWLDRYEIVSMFPARFH